MTQEQQEMALWHDAYMLAMSQDPSPAESSGWADAAVAEFRKRYPAEPAAPAPVWYDDPPFPKDGESYPCWVDDERYACTVHWHREWLMVLVGDIHTHRLDGRRVSPITKPQEPTT